MFSVLHSESWSHINTFVCAAGTKLSDEFQISGIPSLIMVNPDGHIITTSGREEVSKDPSGENWPWGSSGVGGDDDGNTGGSLDDSQRYMVDLACSQLARDVVKNSKRGDRVREDGINMARTLLNEVTGQIHSLS